LFDLPRCSAAFAAGELSYSKARALTRVANCRTEPELLEFALFATASQVEEHCRQLRNGQRRVSTADANRAYNARYLSRSIHEDGSMTISMQLPKEAADLVMKAIDIALALDSKGEQKGEQKDARHTDEAEDSFFQKQADALVEVARGFIAGGADKKSSTADHYQVMVHVDESALNESVNGDTDQGGKSDLPIESVRSIMCDASIVPITKDKNGDLLNVGRKHRVVSPPMKRALVGRDKNCRFPGCTHDKWLDAPGCVQITWSIGSMVVKRVLRTHFCFVANTTDCFTKVGTPFARTLKANGALERATGKLFLNRQCSA